MKVIFDVMGVFLAFYTSIDKGIKCIVPFHIQNLIDFGLIPKTFETVGHSCQKVFF